MRRFFCNAFFPIKHQIAEIPYPKKGKLCAQKLKSSVFEAMGFIKNNPVGRAEHAVFRNQIGKKKGVINNYQVGMECQPGLFLEKTGPAGIALGAAAFSGTAIDQFCDFPAPSGVEPAALIQITGKGSRDPCLQGEQIGFFFFFKELVHADAGTHRYPGLMWTAEGTPNELRTPPVRLGEYNEYVYRELMGVSREEYARLEETGHIGTVYASHLP